MPESPSPTLRKEPAVSGVPSPVELLRTENLSVRYGGVTANEDVCLSVHAGEVVALIGPNGAGKTTFVDAVTGYAPSSGTVHLDDKKLTGGPHKRRRAGLGRTWQAGELFDDVTVADNIAVAARTVGLRTLGADLLGRSRGSRPEEAEALELLGLTDVAHRHPSELSMGRQKLVGVARALVGNTSVVLLDEPAAGLDTHESRQLGHDVRRVAASGRGVLLIDHDMSLVMDFADRIYVLDFGKVIASGTPAEVRSDARVVAAYLGGVA
ncbi:ABC transporter ATP-binding protein [Nocardioides yefusunii]|uniref:ABC transporter ATP-binding protein n=1 Tax=Nocardioides yefusunii TaxID=2500546 RepID=A0ABW1QUB8_9ACTN|nr:ABC transporter ATP-binding protein [Nocardioides yefusunii]